MPATSIRVGNFATPRRAYEKVNDIVLWLRKLELAGIDPYEPFTVRYDCAEDRLHAEQQTAVSLSESHG